MRRNRLIPVWRNEKAEGMMIAKTYLGGAGSRYG
jgi:hypothetical protein